MHAPHYCQNYWNFIHFITPSTTEDCMLNLPVLLYDAHKGSLL